MSVSNPERLLTIGDIHGCHDLLERLLADVAPTASDQLVFLGDYIDRGPQSRQVIETLLALQQRLPETIFLRGNHEQMLLDFLAGEENLMFLLNGGSATLESYQEPGQNKPVIPAEHLTFFNNLQTSFCYGEFIFVHAGLRPLIPISLQDEHDLLWIRGEFINSDYDWGKTVVFGHSPQPEVLFRSNMIGLDTGAVYNNLLTCCDLFSRRLWQVGSADLGR